MTYIPPWHAPLGSSGSRMHRDCIVPRLISPAGLEQRTCTCCVEGRTTDARKEYRRKTWLTWRLRASSNAMLSLDGGHRGLPRRASQQDRPVAHACWDAVLRYLDTASIACVFWSRIDGCSLASKTRALCPLPLHVCFRAATHIGVHGMSELHAAEPHNEGAVFQAWISMRAANNALTLHTARCTLHAARCAMVFRFPGIRVRREVAAMFSRCHGAFGDAVDSEGGTRRDQRRFGV
jgi:hypothetical protein